MFKVNVIRKFKDKDGNLYLEGIQSMSKSAVELGEKYKLIEIIEKPKKKVNKDG